MGDRYYDGDGVKKNDRKAVGYYKKSAAQGNKKAAKNLQFLSQSNM